MSTLYHYSQHGDPAVRTLVNHLLTQVRGGDSQHGDPAVFDGVLADSITPYPSHSCDCPSTQVYLPLHLILHSWVFDGVLADKSLEFFVACDNSSKPDKMWRSKYTLRQSMLPSFISQSLAQKVKPIVV